jgi:Family of unknown function (DUF6677)
MHEVPDNIFISDLNCTDRFIWIFTRASLGGSNPIHCVLMSTPTPTEFNPLSGLAAAVFPGAGHLVLGRPKRALFACIGVMGLFFFGLLIGGIDAIDSKNDRIWFFGQVLVGPPTMLVDFVHQSQFKAYDLNAGVLRSGFPGEQRIHDGSRHVWQPLTQDQIDQGMGPPNTPGLGRLNEIAMLSIVLAGMLNLIIFLDAMMPSKEKHASVSKIKGGEPSPSGGVS